MLKYEFSFFYKKTQKTGFGKKMVLAPLRKTQKMMKKKAAVIQVDFLQKKHSRVWGDSLRKSCTVEIYPRVLKNVFF